TTAARVIACDVRADRLTTLERELGIRVSADPTSADVVVLAVKPQQMSEALAAWRPKQTGKELVISIAAGIPTSRIERELGGRPRVVRVMPNTPALVGAGASALCRGAYATEDDLACAEFIMRAVGIVVRVDESLMDAVTALSGSGPAYVFHLAEALMAAGEAQGLDAATARELTVQTIWGAARLLRESGRNAAELREQVTSPGGTTAAALAVFRERGLMEIYREAVAAATRRGRELAASGAASSHQGPK
ncbi:MAG: pyrroline-5-carboxylate reductase, partial [Verrucomicrobiae bacterium]|nr:pyrroline-5-carboxylate reductase [Verrucomicrobiae bacterium]